MMKRVLLIALNAKFIHSSLAVRSLRAYAGREEVSVLEYTINHAEEWILQEIYERRPEVVGFSCYIWNMDKIARIAENLKKVLPGLVVFFGGPEVSYDAADCLARYPFLDFVIRGEGEAAFRALLAEGSFCAAGYQKISGISYREGGEVVETGDAVQAPLAEIPFVYDSLEGLENRILYYETQRGCPYQCQYCLSSVEQGVRFLPLLRVYSDLEFFLQGRVRQVKFVDRTFNASKAHALAIWRYLIAHDNGVTNFHMEITADLLDAEQLSVLAEARPGLFQFEIGVQSTNGTTLSAIRRNTAFLKLSEAVVAIRQMGNIHTHLDLIVGLPYESYPSFCRSFDDVYALSPEQFQLGFLKLLKGSGLRRDAKKYGIVFQSAPPYEVLETAALPFSDLCRLKRVEEMVELYYNSGKALAALAYLTAAYGSAFSLYQALGDYWQREGHRQVSHKKMDLYLILYQFACQEPTLSGREETARALLRFDLLRQDALYHLPEALYTKEEAEADRQAARGFFAKQEAWRARLPHLSQMEAQKAARMVRVAVFPVDVLHPEAPAKEECRVVFYNYNKEASREGVQCRRLSKESQEE